MEYVAEEEFEESDLDIEVSHLDLYIDLDPQNMIFKINQDTIVML